ncbi:DgyrCDS119 [Dimorphilus gyrociliatus]|uniref:Decapping nuclease n=1 Tax=Dimorphilus gyrociliatus TaxID=2664684 RepID=A0A7I8V562_9ANNE|nr:DgyrCDS119 [Dimorphilus gyrociliatus]
MNYGDYPHPTHQNKFGGKVPPNRHWNRQDKSHQPYQRKSFEHKTKYEKDQLKHPTANTLETNCSLYTSSAFPYFRHPREIGSFSMDENREYLNNRSQLRYYNEAQAKSGTCYDLKEGYDTFISKDENYKEYLDSLLQFITLNVEKFKAVNPLNDKSQKETDICTDFVCWRGLLTKILGTPYLDRQQNSWKLAVIKYRNSYYMCEYDTEERKREAENMTEKHKAMSYWGWKFENCVLSDTEDGVPNAEEPVNNNLSFVSVVRSRLENHSLVYGGEVDGYEKKPDGSCQYIELKTNLALKNIHVEKGFKRVKQLKNWLQSFLLNIPKIVVGFRDDNGIVDNLESFETSKIPTIHGKNFWDACVCFNYLKEFLDWVKSIVTHDADEIISMPYVFEFVPHTGRTHYRKCSEEEMSQYCFIPKWYFEFVENHFKSDGTNLLKYSRNYQENDQS